MTQQSSSNSQAPSTQSISSRRTGVIVLSILGGVLALCLCAVVLLVLVFRNVSNVPSVGARDARIGTELGEDGHIIQDTRTIPADVQKIHLEFYFENPANAKIPLEFRWFAGDQLVYSYSSVHEDGYVAAYIELDPNQGLPAGNYHVEVWFGNTMILSEPFVIE